MCLTLLSLKTLSSMFNTWVRKLRPDSLGHKHTVLSLVGVRSVLNVGSVINMNDWLNFSSSSGMLFNTYSSMLPTFNKTSLFSYLLPFSLFHFSCHFPFISYPVPFLCHFIFFPFYVSCPLFNITLLSFISTFLFLSFSIDLFCSFPF